MGLSAVLKSLAGECRRHARWYRSAVHRHPVLASYPEPSDVLGALESSSGLPIEDRSRIILALVRQQAAAPHAVWQAILLRKPSRRCCSASSGRSAPAGCATASSRSSTASFRPSSTSPTERRWDPRHGATATDHPPRFDRLRRDREERRRTRPQSRPLRRPGTATSRRRPPRPTIPRCPGAPRPSSTAPCSPPSAPSTRPRAGASSNASTGAPSAVATDSSRSSAPTSCVVPKGKRDAFRNPPPRPACPSRPPRARRLCPVRRRAAGRSARGPPVLAGVRASPSKRAAQHVIAYAAALGIAEPAEPVTLPGSTK